MSRIATFILARGGSRRIPKKNIMPFQGRPLILWTIDTAASMGFPVYVFTDMPEIREMMEAYPGVNVREKLFENASGKHETGKELAAYNQEIKADHIILLQPTSPLRSVIKIINWIDEYLDGEYLAGVAARKVQTGFFYRGNSPLYQKEKRNYDSNVMEPVYRETGSFYIFAAGQIRKRHFLNTEKLIVFEDPYSLDINGMGDVK